MKAIIKFSVDDKRYKPGMNMGLVVLLEDILREFYKDKKLRVWEIRRGRRTKGRDL